MRRTLLQGFAVAVAMVGLVGCGGTDSEDGARTQSQPGGGQIVNTPPEPVYTEQEVVAKLGLSGEGPGYDLGDEECVASVILTTPADIDVYAGAGDTVATNDAGSVGIKVGTYQGGPSAAECARRFASLLSDRLP